VDGHERQRTEVQLTDKEVNIMAEITLGKKAEVKSLKVNIGKKTYSIPLAGSLTISEMKRFQDDEDGFSFFGKYIPNEILEDLTMDDFKALSDAWKKASSGEDEDMSVG
jgi:hypothetical protein